uniref:Uncharacterized protein n=1 Tax=Meloidogyne hapla TaxID=6305 RepID=A0A1I8BT63_MELHA
MKEILELKDKKLKKNIKIEEIQTKKKNENEFKEKEQAELLLDQFTKYEGFDLETAISESEKAIDPNTLVAEFKNISKFLSVLQFCATINFKFGKNSNARLLNFYCTHDMLLKAEEILISVNKGYRFGKFSIGNPCGEYI